ncbi:MAG: ABC transporter permease/substrate-binding protein [Flammeovirgaceae bacterium]
MNDQFDLLHYLAEKKVELLARTWEHLWLTGISVILAITLGLFLGIFITRYKRLANPVIGFANMIQTVPSIALLGFLIPFLGIGAVPAILALFLYALLPIIRNTYTGISDIDPNIREAAIGLGMTNWQLLIKVEIPLAMPIIFAGIRTATVINVGVATLCALIAAGGLGEFIFTGIALNNTTLILTGAIPAALLAITIDILLGLIQKNITTWFKPLAIGLGIALAILVVFQVLPSKKSAQLKAGLPAEFMKRPDGWEGLKKAYQLALTGVQMNAGLMYSAVKNAKVDVIGGYSTDGRIDAYNLRVLQDDKNYFPPYHVAPLIRQESLAKYPVLAAIFDKLANQISDKTMRRLNYLVDQEKQSPQKVAKDFVESLGFETAIAREGEAELVIGGKNFTEQFILAEIFTLLIENYSTLNVESKLGLGGTQVAFEALKAGEIDIYPEYTGTGLLVILQPDDQIAQQLMQNSQELFAYVNQEFQAQHQCKWLKPLGFNNTYALMMREEQAKKLGIGSISELAKFVEK